MRRDGRRSGAGHGQIWSVINLVIRQHGEGMEDNALSPTSACDQQRIAFVEYQTSERSDLLVSRCFTEDASQTGFHHIMLQMR